MVVISHFHHRMTSDWKLHEPCWEFTGPKRSWRLVSSGALGLASPLWVDSLHLGTPCITSYRPTLCLRPSCATGLPRRPQGEAPGERSRGGRGRTWAGLRVWSLEPSVTMPACLCLWAGAVGAAGLSWDWLRAVPRPELGASPSGGGILQAALGGRGLGAQGQASRGCQGPEELRAFLSQPELAFLQGRPNCQSWAGPMAGSSRQPPTNSQMELEN